MGCALRVSAGGGGTPSRPLAVSRRSTTRSSTSRRDTCIRRSCSSSLLPAHAPAGTGRVGARRGRDDRAAPVDASCPRGPDVALLWRGAAVGAGHQRCAALESVHPAGIRARRDVALPRRRPADGDRTRPVASRRSCSSGRCSCGRSRRGGCAPSRWQCVIGVPSRWLPGRRSGSTDSRRIPTSSTDSPSSSPIAATRSSGWRRPLDSTRRGGDSACAARRRWSSRRLRLLRATRRRATRFHLRGRRDARAQPVVWLHYLVALLVPDGDHAAAVLGDLAPAGAALGQPEAGLRRRLRDVRPGDSWRRSSWRRSSRRDGGVGWSAVRRHRRDHRRGERGRRESVGGSRASVSPLGVDRVLRRPSGGLPGRALRDRDRRRLGRGSTSSSSIARPRTSSTARTRTRGRRGPRPRRGVPGSIHRSRRCSRFRDAPSAVGSLPRHDGVARRSALAIPFVLGVRTGAATACSSLAAGPLRDPDRNITLWLGARGCARLAVPRPVVLASASVGVTLAVKLFLWPLVVGSLRRVGGDRGAGHGVGFVLLLRSWAVIGFDGSAGTRISCAGCKTLLATTRTRSRTSSTISAPPSAVASGAGLSWARRCSPPVPHGEEG